MHIAASEGRNFERWQALVGTPIFEAYAQSKIRIWPNLANAVFTSKFMLAYLSDADFDGTFEVTPKERLFLNQVLPWARLLTPSVAQTAKLMVQHGLKVVIKPGHGSGGRGVYVLTPHTKNYSYLLNKHSRSGDYICMIYAAAEPVEGNLVSTMDAVMFLEASGSLKADDIIYTSRVFQGEKVNTVTEGAGLSPVMIDDTFKNLA